MDATGVFVLLWILLYFLPTIIAALRKARMTRVLVINLLLGWTVIGWFVALVMAFIRPPVAGAGAARDPAEEPTDAVPPPWRETNNLLYTRQFLESAFDRGVIDASAFAGLMNDLERHSAPPVPVGITAEEAPAPTTVAVHPPPHGVAEPPPAPVLAEAPAPRVPPAPPRLSPWSQWMQEVRKARAVVRSDFAIHGLAYLGVLLTFAGTLGFVLFAYASVKNQWLRALGPLAVPAFLGLTSWMLYRRGSVLVSVSLELLGAALVPVLLSAALSTLIPATGIQFALRTVMAIALALIYAAAVVRRPASPLKYLVAPMLWTAVWTAGLYFRGRYSPAQVALTAVAILLTVAVTQLQPKLRFARPTRLAAIPGVAAVFTLSILFAVTEGGPPLPILLTGLATLITAEFLAVESRRAVQLSLLQSLLLAISLGAVMQGWGVATVGMLATLGYLAILEWQERRRPHPYALLIPLTGLLVGLALAVSETWPALIAGAVASTWVHARRLWPVPSHALLPGRETGIAMMVAAATFPVVSASGAWRLLPEGRALLIVAALLLVLTLTVRRWRPVDDFYAWWLPVAAGALTIAAASTVGTGSTFELAAAVALAGGCLALAPRWPIVRIWSSFAAFIWASLLLFDAISLNAAARPVVWSLAALIIVAAASTRRSVAAGHLALAGYIWLAVMLYAAAPGGPIVITLAAWTLAWLASVVSHELGGSPLVALVQWASPRVRITDRLGPVLPPLVLVISAPFLVAEAGDFFAITTRHRSWTGLALATTALAYSAAARFTAARRPLAAVLATASVLLSGIAIAVAAPDLEPSILAVAGSVAVVGIMGGALRRPFMSWFAWTMAIVLSLLLALKAGVAVGSLHLVLIGSGGFLMIAGLVYDEVRAGLRRSGQGLRIPWLTAPVSLGALTVPVGLAFSFTDKPSVYGWWTIAAAALYLVVAILLRTGAVTGVSYALAAFGVVSLVPWQPLEHPVLLLPLAAALVAASFALSLLRPSSDAWLRWDIPPLVVGHLVAALALARTAEADSLAVTWAGLGLLSLAVAVWRRHWAWAAAGAVLVLVGGQAAGHGWFALALAATGAGSILAALRTRGLMQSGLQVIGVVMIGGAWLEGMAWARWSTDQEIAFTALASGGLAVATSGVARLVSIYARTLAPWSVLATVGITSSAAVGTAVYIGRPVAFAVAAGLVLYALACITAVGPFQWAWLSWPTVGALAWAWGETVIGASWSAGQATAFTALLAGGVAAALAALLVNRRLPSSWFDPSAAATIVALAAASVVSGYLQLNLEPDHRLAALGVGLGAALFAAATAAVARLLWWPYLAVVSVGAAGWSWVEMSLAVGWSVDQGVAFTALAAGMVGIATAARARFARISNVWTLSWESIAAAGLGGAIITGATVGNQRDPYALGVAGGLALYAVGAGLLARPLGWPWLREVAAVLAVVSAATVLYDRQPSVEQSVAIAVGAGLAALVVSLGVWRGRPASPWLRPLSLFASLAGVGGLALSLVAWPGRGPLVITLLVLGAEAAAVGLTLRQPTPLYAAPVLVCAAWLVFATDALQGNPNWLTVPIGLALLIVVELARWDRRLRTAVRNDATPPGLPVLPSDEAVTTGLLVLEYVGMVFLVGAALVQTIFESLWYGLLGAFLGVALIGWAAFTRVRRRTEVGAVVVILSIFLMLTVPAVRLIPQLHDIALWGTVAAIGVLLLLVATTIEQSRARVMAGIRRLDQLMTGWE